MAQEFKFGDLVRVVDDDKGFLGRCGVVVGIHDCSETLDIVLGPEQPSECLLMESVVLIPHPDTVRLEKIGRLAVEAMGMAFDLDEYRRQIDQIGEQA